MSTLHDLTVLIPSLERQLVLEKTVSYWSGREPRILILDGSKNPLSKVFLSQVGENITYVHAPINLSARLRLGGEMLGTEYACIQGQDEIHLPSSLLSCVNKLDGDPSLVSCIGRPIGFAKTQSGDFRFTSVYPTLKDYSVRHPDPLTRIQMHIDPYMAPATIYSVCRSKQFNNTVSSLSPNSMKYFLAQSELEFEMLMAAQGNIGTIRKLHWLRRIEPSFFLNTDIEFSESNPFYLFWENEANFPERENLLHHLASQVAKNVGENVEITYTSLTNYFSSYAQWQKSFIKDSYPRWMAARKLLRKVAPPLHVTLREKRRLAEVQNWLPFSEILLRLKDEGTEFESYELAEALTYLEDY